MNPDTGILFPLAGAVFVIIGGYWALGRIVVAQFNIALDARFDSLEKARKEGAAVWEERFRRLEKKQDQTEQEVRGILTDLPKEYVRREDYVRSQTIVEAKLDGLALRIENSFLRGQHGDRKND